MHGRELRERESDATNRHGEQARSVEERRPGVVFQRGVGVNGRPAVEQSCVAGHVDEPPSKKGEAAADRDGNAIVVEKKEDLIPPRKQKDVVDDQGNKRNQWGESLSTQQPAG